MKNVAINSHADILNLPFVKNGKITRKTINGGSKFRLYKLLKSMTRKSSFLILGFLLMAALANCGLVNTHFI
jgi:hypothetical protein